MPLAARAEVVIFAAAADMTQRGLVEFVTQRGLVELTDASVGTIHAEVQRLMLQLAQPDCALINHDDDYFEEVMDLVAAQSESLMTALLMQDAEIHFGQPLIDRPAVSEEERGQMSDFWQQQHGWVDSAEDIAEPAAEGTVAKDEALLAICISCFASIDKKYTSKLQSAVEIMGNVLVDDIRGEYEGHYCRCEKVLQHLMPAMNALAIEDVELATVLGVWADMAVTTCDATTSFRFSMRPGMATKQYAVIQEPKQNYKMVLCQVWHQMKEQQVHSLKSDWICRIKLWHIRSQLHSCMQAISKKSEKRRASRNSSMSSRKSKIKNKQKKMRFGRGVDKYTPANEHNGDVNQAAEADRAKQAWWRIHSPLDQAAAKYSSILKSHKALRWKAAAVSNSTWKNQFLWA